MKQINQAKSNPGAGKRIISDFGIKSSLKIELQGTSSYQPYIKKFI